MARAETDVAIQIVPSCDECDRVRAQNRVARRPRPTQGARECVLVEMAPGPDGAPWYLCVPHWFEGLHPNDFRALGSGRVVEQDRSGAMSEEVFRRGKPPDHYETLGVEPGATTREINAAYIRKMMATLPLDELDEVIQVAIEARDVRVARTS